MTDYSFVGKRVPRIDALEKATGAARFTDDLELPHTLHGRILWSPHAHARILHIDTSKAERLPGVKAVITGKDWGNFKYGVFPATRDQHPLAVDKVRYIGDEVAAVAATDGDTAEEALELIRVEYEVLPPVFDPDEAMREGAPLVHDAAPGNVSIHARTELGEVDKGFRESDYLREDRFETQAVAHCQLEPYVALASVDPSGKLEIWTPNQSPFTKRRALANALRMPLDDVRVLKSYIGGAFGGRSETFALDFCAALLSRRTGRPVKITYSREESFRSTRQKHPFILYLKTGVKRDGTIVAKDLRIVADGGAYNSTGAIAMSNPPTMLLPLFRIPNFRYEALRVYTNKPVRGAMRGHGSQQVRFADGCQLDMIAEDLGLDPVEIRLKNAVETGERLINGSVVYSSGLKECIEKAVEASGWEEKKRQLAPGRGIGIGTACTTCGFSLGIRSSSAAFVKFNEDGQATLFTGTQDNGQGNWSMVAQIAAEELGVPMQDIRLVAADTETTPQDPGTYSMSTTFISGNAAKAAAADARKQLLEIAAEKLEANADDLEAREGRIYVKGSPDKGLGVADVVKHALALGRPIMGKGSFMPDMDPINYLTGDFRGQNTGTWSFGAVVAEVQVDRQTGRVTLEKVTAAHDCGRAINPNAVEGQAEGSAVLGQGQVLTEELKWDGGTLLNASFLDYGIPTAVEAPEINTIIVETIDPNGPFGAKEAAEPVNVAIIPAIANAIYHATGVRFKSLPVTAEKIVDLRR
ncbi:MAG: molybdopterin-dependent oxidoreductase [Chloroflexi bacterium]|nr:molybdopterin-dependent oxidoreductase [Chloroflexota bacterium]